MEHREPSGTIVEDSESRPAAAATRQLEPPRPARPQPHRLELNRNRAGIAALVFVLVFLGLYLVDRARSAAMSWLADQPAYQLDFGAIALDPEPPRWYRGGTPRFVQEVRRLSGMPAKVPLLKLRTDELKKVFKLSPWTEDVLKVSRRPMGVTIHLAYHRPVALVEVSPAERYLIDESAIILPHEDLDRDVGEFADQELLIWIKGKGLAAPRNPTPGLEWKCRPGLSEIDPGNGQIPAAARLALFLAAKLRSVDLASHPELEFTYINPMDDSGEYRGLFLWNPSEKTYVLWGDAPGQERAGGLDAERKWQKLYDWSRSGKPRILPDGWYWSIAESGLVPDGHDRRPPGSARRAPRRQDAGAILTHGSGQ